MQGTRNVSEAILPKVSREAVSCNSCCNCIFDPHDRAFCKKKWSYLKANIAGTCSDFSPNGGSNGNSLVALEAEVVALQKATA